MSFNDDEHIFLTQEISGEKRPKTNLKIIKNPVAPLEESEFKVLLELKGLFSSGSGTDRLGLDLVTVLDISASMAGERLEKLKKAMRFVVKKLTPVDRLSVVAFSDEYVRLCPLRQVNEKSKSEIEISVDSLAAKGNTNIVAGLETALKVLEDRRLKRGRVAAIILVCDGEQNRGNDAAKVPTRNVPVYTFGLGARYDPKVLKDIADNSAGGTFSDVQNTDDLTVALSQCLAGLLSVVIKDVKLTVTQLESTIEKVSIGNYPLSKDDDAITVSIGDLYTKEVRRIVVDLLLPAATRRSDADILEISYTYRTGERKFHGNPIVISLTRASTSTERVEREEVLIEENRLWIVNLIKEARALADEKKNAEAGNKIVEALRGKFKVDQSHPSVSALNLELNHLLPFIETDEAYNKKGRRIVLSSESSHEHQRYAARGDVAAPRLYSTPRTDAYLLQAKAFDEDPSDPVPSLAEDASRELLADPLAPMVGALSCYIQSAIQILKPLGKVLSADRERPIYHRDEVSIKPAIVNQPDEVSIEPTVVNPPDEVSIEPTTVNHPDEVSIEPTIVNVYCKTDPNFMLAIRNGKLILACADGFDESQHWYKDEKYSSRVKDSEGYPSFSLVNKATNQALTNSHGRGLPVQVIPYSADSLDKSILWTQGPDLGDGFRAIRAANDIILSLDNKGADIMLSRWHKLNNKHRWKIEPLGH